MIFLVNVSLFKAYIFYLLMNTVYGGNYTRFLILIFTINKYITFFTSFYKLTLIQFKIIILL